MIRLLTALACAGVMVGCTTVHLTVIVPPAQPESQPDSLVALEPLYGWIRDTCEVPDTDTCLDWWWDRLDTLTIDTTRILKWIEL